MTYEGIYSLTIRTPEGVTFTLPLASPVTRFLAWLIDCMCVAAAVMVILQIVRPLALINEDFAGALAVLLFFVVQIGYGIGTEWLWRGQTVGKRLFRLRVMDESGLRLQFSQIVIRNLLRLVDGLPIFYLLGGTACLISRRAQRLGDLAASTVVVRGRQLTAPNLATLLAGKYNSFRNYPHLEARLRQSVPPEQARSALQALVRRDHFLPQARVELFREMALHFKSLVQFPQEATEELADEQYVRNVVDSVFRTPSSDGARQEPAAVDARSADSPGVRDERS